MIPHIHPLPFPLVPASCTYRQTGEWNYDLLAGGDFFLGHWTPSPLQTSTFVCSWLKKWSLPHPSDVYGLPVPPSLCARRLRVSAGGLVAATSAGPHNKVVMAYTRTMNVMVNNRAVPQHMRHELRHPEGVLMFEFQPQVTRCSHSR